MRRMILLMLLLFSSVNLAYATTGQTKNASPETGVLQAQSIFADEFTDYKEEVNNALASLKSQIDTTTAANQDVKVSGVLFLRWQGGSNTTVGNFDIDRAYLDFKKALSGGASLRVTLDGRRITGAARQEIFDYLKYAYVELPTALPQNWSVSSVLRLGLQQTMWIDWADKMLDLRWIARSLVDNESVMSSSDFGVGALGKVTTGRVPEVEYHATLVNGSGYSNAESNNSKDIGLRLNTNLWQDEKMGNLLIGAYANLRATDWISLGGTTQQMGGMLGLKNDLFTLYGEYLNGSGTTNTYGYSLGGKYALLRQWLVFARTDKYDPDTSVANNDTDRLFYGLIYALSDEVKFALDMQGATTAGVTNNIAYVHSLVKF